MSLNDETRSDVSPTLSSESDDITDSYSCADSANVSRNSVSDANQVTQSDDDFVILEQDEEPVEVSESNKLEQQVINILSQLPDIQASLFQFGISQQYVADIYESVKQQLTQSECDVLQKYVEGVFQEEEPQAVKQYKTQSLQSFVEDPRKKCPKFLHYIDCTCNLPSYIVSFLEEFGDYLEKKANVQLESLKAIYRGEDKIPAEKLSNLLYRELPVNNINIAPQKMVIKRRFDSFGFYSQNIQSHFGYIPRIQTIQQFKIELHKFLHTTKLSQHASFQNQDFKYIPSCFKIMMQLDTPVFSDPDVDKITNKYVAFYQQFQQVKAMQQVQNIPKLFVTIMKIINNDATLNEKYNELGIYSVKQN